MALNRELWKHLSFLVAESFKCALFQTGLRIYWFLCFTLLTLKATLHTWSVTMRMNILQFFMVMVSINLFASKKTFRIRGTKIDLKIYNLHQIEPFLTWSPLCFDLSNTWKSCTYLTLKITVQTSHEGVSFRVPTTTSSNPYNFYAWCPNDEFF